MLTLLQKGQAFSLSGRKCLKTEFFNLLSLKLPIADIEVVGFSHCLLKNSIFAVDSMLFYLIPIPERAWRLCATHSRATLDFDRIARFNGLRIPAVNFNPWRSRKK